MNHNYMHITIVLDSSASMRVIRDSVISGLNEFLDEQKQFNGKTTVTLVTFSSTYQVEYNGVSVHEIPYRNNTNYFPFGMTALHDAMGRAIVETGHFLSDIPEHERPSKVLFLTVTDGYENSSVEISQNALSEMITRQSSVYSWQFVYLGANQDSFEVATGIGIKGHNSRDFDFSQVGTKSMFRDLKAATTTYRCASSPTVDNFFAECNEPNKKNE